MRLSAVRLTLGLAAVIALTAVPAFAQHRGGGHGGGGGRASGGQAAARSGGPRAAGGGGGARSYAPRTVAPRANYAVRGGYATRGYAYAAPRGSYSYASRYYGGARYGYARVAPVRFYRPYYAFRPRVSLGFGLWVGYPFAYDYSFYDPYYYGYPYAYPSYAYPSYPYPAPYPAPAPYPYQTPGYSVAPPATLPPTASAPPPAPAGLDEQNMGGLSFQITPSDAQIFVDGANLGTVGEFTPTSQPLGLRAGRHHVEIRAPGYQTMSFDVDVMGGEVIPYQGTMQR